MAINQTPNTIKSEIEMSYWIKKSIILLSAKRYLILENGGRHFDTLSTFHIDLNDKTTLSQQFEDMQRTLFTNIRMYELMLQDASQNDYLIKIYWNNIILPDDVKTYLVAAERWLQHIHLELTNRS